MNYCLSFSRQIKFSWNTIWWTPLVLILLTIHFSPISLPIFKKGSAARSIVPGIPTLMIMASWLAGLRPRRCRISNSEEALQTKVRISPSPSPSLAATQSPSPWLLAPFLTRRSKQFTVSWLSFCSRPLPLLRSASHPCLFFQPSTIFEAEKILDSSLSMEMTLPEGPTICESCKHEAPESMPISRTSWPDWKKEQGESFSDGRQYFWKLDSHCR